jgi:hypothetical protein
MNAGRWRFACNAARRAASNRGNNGSMTHLLATLLVGLLTAYLGIGTAFSLAFIAIGVHRIDPMARGAGWGFRLLIAPGAALLWPLLLVRWAAGSVAPAVETNAHRRRAGRAA